MKKNCHNCKHGEWDSDGDEYSSWQYFACDKREDDGYNNLENNLCRPEYLEKAKVCCHPKEPGEMIVDLTCPKCGDIFTGYARDEGGLCLDCYGAKYFSNH